MTSPVFLNQLTPSGRLVSTLRVPDGPGPGGGLVTSFSSKSELALNLSTSDRDLTFMGYVAKPDTIDVSNSNTPGVVDPTNPVPSTYYRAVATLDAGPRQLHRDQRLQRQQRARGHPQRQPRRGRAVHRGQRRQWQQPAARRRHPGSGRADHDAVRRPEVAQQPGQPTPVGSFSVTQLGDAADKVGKDTNFRGMTIFDHVLYYTKGSGSNGVNTVYFVESTQRQGGLQRRGPARPGARLPANPIAYDPSLLQTQGVSPTTCASCRASLPR